MASRPIPPLGEADLVRTEHPSPGLGVPLGSQEVEPLDSYAAKRCPVRVAFDQVPPDTSPVPDAPAVELRRRQGWEDERVVIDRLAGLDNVVQIDRQQSAQRNLEATTQAMNDGALLIVGGVIENDQEGKRKGSPDLLRRAEHRDGRWRYVPLEVKAHRTVRPREGAVALISELDDLADTDIERGSWPDMMAISGRRATNGMQLAHFHRMLQATNRQSADAWGGVIGREGRVLWLDLSSPVTPEGGSLLDRYNTEFSRRLAAVAAVRNPSPGSTALTVVPVRTHECDDCRWRHHCLPIVEARRCVSSIQGVGLAAWETYQTMNVATIDELAEIDWASANLMDQWESDGPALHRVVDEPSALADVLDNADSANRRLLVEQWPEPDFRRFDRRVLQSNGWPTGRLASHVDAARALAWTPDGACLRRGLDELRVPAFDREIDIDMESSIEGFAYLWGTYEAADDVATADVEWSDDAQLAAALVFEAFWSRLTELEAAAARAEQSIGFYCWHDEAEKGALRSGASAAAKRLGRVDAPEEVERWLDEGRLIDLCAIAREDLVTGGSKSLKAMAPLAGFSWRDEDPNGASSMVWHANAIDPARPLQERERWRQRLLIYNEDDVRAEAAVRHWMRSTELRSVSELAPAPR